MPLGDTGNACGAMDPGLRRDDGRGGQVFTLPFLFLKKMQIKELKHLLPLVVLVSSLCVIPWRGGRKNECFCGVLFDYGDRRSSYLSSRGLTTQRSSFYVIPRLDRGIQVNRVLCVSTDKIICVAARRVN